MIGILWNASKGYRWRPWRSPYLRWRIETYQGWHADQITARDFWRFVWQNRRELLRYARWASKMAGHRPFAPLAQVSVVLEMCVETARVQPRHHWRGFRTRVKPRQ